MSLIKGSLSLFSGKVGCFGVVSNTRGVQRMGTLPWLQDFCHAAAFAPTGHALALAGEEIDEITLDMT